MLNIFWDSPLQWLKKGTKMFNQFPQLLLQHYHFNNGYIKVIDDKVHYYFDNCS